MPLLHNDEEDRIEPFLYTGPVVDLIVAGVVDPKIRRNEAADVAVVVPVVLAMIMIRSMIMMTINNNRIQKRPPLGTGM